MTIDDALPTWHWRSVHAARVAAQPERADAAIRVFGAPDLPLTGALMRIRGLGRRVFDDRPLLQSLARIGMVVLIDEPGTVVLGGALSPWRLRGGHCAMDSLDAFCAFATPEWVRVATAFTVDGDGAGSRIGTETRIEATDDAARRRFGRYWRLVGPFSSITRREMLSAIRRRAEA
jgi:hypothetical protein